ncbi:inactive ubiquitin carboxyl-terminal hydrolase 54-like isoform X2 [Vespula squamosa]|uniref:Inactive ubiquitin carboxyl-terminal hydrolase 54-like isoform X2 n=1 Tax=Vespula squamosa TaxID=30214 RepID=A0ABD2BPE5_VESSQ
MPIIMGLQQQATSQDTVDFPDYLKPSTQYHQVHGSLSQNEQKSPHRDHNTSFTSTKGLLNGPGQNNCFLNSAVQRLSMQSSCQRETELHLTQSSSFEDFAFAIGGRRAVVERARARAVARKQLLHDRKADADASSRVS